MGANPHTDDRGYGMRPDGTPKGRGYFGELKRPGGGVSTELSVGVEMDGKEVLIPSLVPTLGQAEIDELLNLKEGDMPSDQIIQKAYEHAIYRMNRGLNPFAD